MNDIRDARPIGEPPDDSPGYCCVAAGMHEGHDADCPNKDEALKDDWSHRGPAADERDEER